MDFTPNGAPVIAWFNHRHHDVHLQVHDGSAWRDQPVQGSRDGSAAGKGVSNSDGMVGLPSLAIGENGFAYLAWDDDSSGNAEVYVYLNAAGGAWAELDDLYAEDPGEGISENAGKSMDPSIAVGPDGTPYVAWMDDSSGNKEIYVKRWDWDQNRWVQVGATSAVRGGISDDERDSLLPALAVAPDGTLYVAWLARDAERSDIHVKRWNGTAWQEVGLGSAQEGGISDTPGYTGAPLIGIDPDGVVYVAWGQEIDGEQMIYVRRSPAQ
jgi:hypothetical protein